MTRINRTKGLILLSLLVIGAALTGSTIVLSALAEDQGTVPNPQGLPPEPTNSTLLPRDPPWMSQLTDDQKAQVEQLLDSLNETGATQQETRDSVNAKLQEWGIEVLGPPPDSGQ